MKKHRLLTTPLAQVYPMYVAKLERKGRVQAELDEVLRWLTGYSQSELEAHLDKGTDFESFFLQAPSPHPDRSKIRGVVCGVRVEEVEEPVMREIRRLDKVVDDLAKGRPMERALPM